MDNIQKHADDVAWDKKVDRRTSDMNRAIERGLSGEALGALHGLHMAPSDQPPYDVDDHSKVDDQETLRDKIIWRTIQLAMRFRAIAIYPMMSRESGSLSCKSAIQAKK